MGYRSDVAIQCREKAFELLRTAWNEHKFYPDDIYQQEDTFLVKWFDVKWYDGYEEIDAITDVLRECDDNSEDRCFHYQFIRVGEDTIDIEEYSNGDVCDLYVNRTIDIYGDIGKYVRQDFLHKVSPIKSCDTNKIM